MKRVGEDLAVYRRSKTLRCFSGNGTVYGHNSGESLKWAPKVHGLRILISQAKGQRTQALVIYWRFAIKPEYVYALAFLFTYLT